MSINNTLNYLLAKQSDVMLCFSDQVTTSSTYLKGAGGQAGDGFPLPRDARLYRIDCWDGSVLVSDTDNIEISQGDRISVYATANGGVMDVKVRINGSDTALVAAGCLQNATLMVTIHLNLI